MEEDREKEGSAGRENEGSENRWRSAISRFDMSSTSSPKPEPEAPLGTAVKEGSVG